MTDQPNSPDPKADAGAPADAVPSTLPEDHGVSQAEPAATAAEPTAVSPATATEQSDALPALSPELGASEAPPASPAVSEVPSAAASEDVSVAVPDSVTAFSAPELGVAAEGARRACIDMLDDVELDVKIELGRTSMYIEEVLKLGVGSVVALDKLAGDPVDIYVNDRLIAHGEVLVLNENFCVRINDIHSPIPELDNGQ